MSSDPDDSAKEIQQFITEVRQVQAEIHETNQSAEQRRAENVRLLIALGILGFTGSLYLRKQLSFPTLEEYLATPFVHDLFRWYVYLLVVYIIVKIFQTGLYTEDVNIEYWPAKVSKVFELIVHAPLLVILFLVIGPIVNEFLPSPSIQPVFMVWFALGATVFTITSIIIVNYIFLDDKEILNMKKKIVGSAIANAPLEGGRTLSYPEIGVNTGLAPLGATDGDRAKQKEFSKIMDRILDDERVPIQRADNSSELLVSDAKRAKRYYTILKWKLKLKRLI